MPLWKSAMVLGLLLIITPVMSQEMYRWVDENGNLHFSQNPPVENQQAELIRVETSRASSSTPSNSSAAAATGGNQAGNQTATAAAVTQGNPGYGKDPEMCSQILQSLQTMRTNENIVMTDPATGNGVYLSETERQAEIIRLQNMQSYYC